MIQICLYFYRDWEYLFASQKVLDQFVSTKKMICISAHSTPLIDGILLHIALHKLGILNHIFYVRGLFGFCPEWCKEISYGMGFIKGEIELLKYDECFCRVIFPSGGNVKWRTGFYILAKETKSTIIILGLDYNKKQIIIDSCLSTNEDFNTVKLKAIKRLKKYNPGPIY